MIKAYSKLKDCKTVINGLIAKIKEEYDEELINKIKNITYDVYLYTSEIIFLQSDNALRSFLYITKDILKFLNENTDIEQIKERLNDYFNILDFTSEDILKNYYSSVPYSTRSIISSNNIFNFSYVEKIADIIEESNNDINMLCVNANPYADYSRIKEKLNQATFYATNVDSSTSTELRKNFNKIAFGNSFGLKISNNVFDLVFNIYPYEAESNNSILHADMLSLFKYVRSEGYLCLLISTYNLTREMCNQLARYCENIDIIYPDEYSETKMILLVCKKALDKTPNENVFNKVRALYDCEKHESKVNKIRFYRKGINIDTFKGSIIDINEINNIFSTSTLLDTEYEQSLKQITTRDSAPLLPFNIGQIGLVLTSGCLDGIIQEDEYNMHVIKGKVVKITETEKRKENGQNVVEETISNRVNINLFLGDGTYKELN